MTIMNSLNISQTRVLLFFYHLLCIIIMQLSCKFDACTYLWCLHPGVRVKETPRRRVPEENGRTVWVCFVHCKFIQGQTAWVSDVEITFGRFFHRPAGISQTWIFRLDLWYVLFQNMLTGGPAWPPACVLILPALFMWPVRWLKEHFNLFHVLQTV